VTVNLSVCVPELPSPIAASAIESEGFGSSLVIVPFPCATEIVAFVGLLSLTTNVSFVS
jgi:hypothetical protein